jgi:hypothetical protein
MYTKKDWKCCSKSNGETEEVKMLKGLHYAKAVCKHCKHFIKWLQDPKITKECDNRKKKIETLLDEHFDDLTEKQTQFLNSVKERRFLTPSQYRYLMGLFELSN